MRLTDAHVESLWNDFRELAERYGGTAKRDVFDATVSFARAGDVTAQRTLLKIFKAVNTDLQQQIERQGQEERES